MKYSCLLDESYSYYRNVLFKKIYKLLKEMDIPAEGPPMASKLYTVPYKYKEFVDHESKSLKRQEWSLEVWVSGPASYWLFPRKEIT